VLHVGELAARDIMVPRAQMDLIDVDASLEDIMAFAVEKTHSRFPVFEGQRDNIMGILLAKDLIQSHFRPNIAVRSVLRPAVFIPETKRVNVLLRDFRLNHNHIAMVVDEFGGVSGLITIEDVLEQIVGNIEDEYDFDDTLDNIVPIQMRTTWDNQPGLPLAVMAGGLNTQALSPNSVNPTVYRVKGATDITQFNAVCGATLPQDQATTVGGLLCSSLGHVPRRGDVHVLAPWRFQVLLADERHVQLLKIQALSDDELAQWEQQTLTSPI
jgi:magnesium and cobalt transporter